jgi:hypothetical protein
MKPIFRFAWMMILACSFVLRRTSVAADSTGRKLNVLFIGESGGHTMGKLAYVGVFRQRLFLI